MIVSQKLARSTWGTEDPVGRNLVLDYQRGPYPYEVVGVVRDARNRPRSEPVPEIFIPHAQNPYLVMNVIARTTTPAFAIEALPRTGRHGRMRDQLDSRIVDAAPITLDGLKMCVLRHTNDEDSTMRTPANRALLGMPENSPGLDPATSERPESCSTALWRCDSLKQTIAARPPRSDDQYVLPPR